LEQAVREVALVALQALQAARARRQDLEVSLGGGRLRGRQRAGGDHRAQRDLVLPQLLFLAKAHLRRDVGTADAEGAALAAAAVALANGLAAERLDGRQRLAQLHRAVAGVVEEIARCAPVDATRPTERD